MILINLTQTPPPKKTNKKSKKREQAEEVYCKHRKDETTSSSRQSKNSYNTHSTLAAKHRYPVNHVIPCCPLFVLSPLT